MWRGKNVAYTIDERYYVNPRSNEFVQTIIETDFGELTIYNDENYLYILNEFKDVKFVYGVEKMLYVGPENTLLSGNVSNYLYDYGGDIVKIPIDNFSNNQEIAVFMRFYILQSDLSYAYQTPPPDPRWRYRQYIYLNGPETKVLMKEDDYEAKYFLYKITKCCNLTE